MITIQLLLISPLITNFVWMGSGANVYPQQLGWEAKYNSLGSMFTIL